MRPKILFLFPQEWDHTALSSLGDEYEFMGYSSREMNEFAFTALSRRLKVIGVGLPTVPA